MNLVSMILRGEGETCHFAALVVWVGFDFLARISHQPFVKDIPQRGKAVSFCIGISAAVSAELTEYNG